MDVYARLKELGLELGKPTPAGGIYSPVRFYSEKMVYTGFAVSPWCIFLSMPR